MSYRVLTVFVSITLAAACGNRATAPLDGGSRRARDGGSNAPRRTEAVRPFVVRLSTDSAPDADSRTLRVETSATGLAGPYRSAGTWDGARDLAALLPATFPNSAIAIDTRGAIRAAEIERALAALFARGVREATVHAEGERPLLVRVNMDEIDFLFSFNVLLRAADARWTTWTAGGMQAIWILDQGPSQAADEAFALGEQIRLRRPQRVIIAHGGGRAGVQGWMRRVRVACETCRGVECECYVGVEPVVDNGAPAAPADAEMRARVTVSRGGAPVADVVRALGGTLTSDAAAPVVLPALQGCAYRPQNVASARLSATLTVDANGFARDLSGEPMPFPMRCVADVLSRRTYPPASAQYRITITADLTQPGHPVPRLIDRRQQRERERAGTPAPTTPTPTPTPPSTTP